MPVVSVILPTYNRNDYIVDAIDSVSNQSYDDIELIIIDDCSTEPVKETLANSRIEVEYQVIRHETNRGQNAARNTGLTEATGEYIAFIDDDDRWKPDKIQKQVSTFERSTENVGLVYTGYNYIDEENNVVREVCRQKEGDVIKEYITGKFDMAPFSAVMIKSAVLERAGYPDENMPNMTDREWFLRIMRDFHVKSVPEILMTRRVDADERTSQWYDKRKNISVPRFKEKHLGLAEELGCKREFLSFLNYSIAANAMRVGEYRDARRYTAKSIYHYPFIEDRYIILFACLGGRFTYTPLKNMKQFVTKSQSS